MQSIMWCARTTQRVASRCSSKTVAVLQRKNGLQRSCVLPSGPNHSSSRWLSSIRPKPQVQKSQQELDAEYSLPTLELHEVTMETHIRNFATAIALFCFCGGVYYYTALQAGSLRRPDQDVGDELRLEAKEAMLTQRQRQLQREQMDKTLKPGFGNPDLEGDDVPDDAILAAAAPDDVAQKEEDANYELLQKNNRKK